jgi:hypothetical protein
VVFAAVRFTVAALVLWQPLQLVDAMPSMRARAGHVNSQTAAMQSMRRQCSRATCQ